MYGFCRLFHDCLYFSSYIVLCSSNFSVTGVNNVYLSVVDWIFSLIFFMESFEVCYLFDGFVYVYCLFHQIVVVFCYVLHCRNVVQFFVFVNFSNVHVCFVFPCRIVAQFFFCIFLILLMFMSVLCSVEEKLFSSLFFCICQM